MQSFKVGRSNPRFFIQAALYQARHVVYHSHYARILNPHGADNAERAQIFGRTKTVRSRDEGAIPQ